MGANQRGTMVAPVPDRDRWVAQARQRPLFRVLGLRADDIGDGYAQYAVAATSGGRGSVVSFAATVAADQCVLDATVTTLDPAAEATNGTAEMNLTFVEAPAGALTVRGDVVARTAHLSVVAITVLDIEGREIARGRGSYAVRPLR